MNEQIETAVAKVKKRDGTFAKFDIKRIINAVEKLKLFPAVCESLGFDSVFFNKNDITICIEVTWFALSIMLIAGKIKNGIITIKKLEETNE